MIGPKIHFYRPPGIVTACGKDANRVRGTWLRGEATCPKCEKAMEAQK